MAWCSGIRPYQILAGHRADGQYCRTVIGRKFCVISPAWPFTMWLAIPESEPPLSPGTNSRFLRR